MIVPVLLCGGVGTRLWPLSRGSFPKQFAPILSDRSLFQQSATRVVGDGFDAPLVVTADPFRFLVLEQLAQVEVAPAGVLIEPDGRNTAPAVAAAALWQARRDPGALLLVLPADHVIADAPAFRQAVLRAAPAARDGRIVTFGVVPTYPETGFGYLELADRPGAADEGPVPLARFVEKPELAVAEAMVAGGCHLWNAGIFLFSAATILDAFGRHAPALLAAVEQALAEAAPDLAFTRLEPAAWSAVESISVDFAIMEKAGNLSVMPIGSGWSDLGSWTAVQQQIGPDSAGNVLSRQAVAIGCRNALLRAESDDQVLVGIGLENIVAVAMPDAVLVAHKDHVQDVKRAVAILGDRGFPQASALPKDFRPWGWYETVARGPRFQVKRICVKPGGSLSLQSHHHRSEHWTVVEGTARVTVNGEVRLLSESESVHVPLGAVHRLENPGKVPLSLIEVQTGPYLGEDDIIRYEDAYARV